MIAYTDYPIGQSQGAVVEVRVRSHDRNKYATVEYQGELHSVKAGYLRQDPGLTRYFPASRWLALPCSPDDPVPTRRALARALKDRRKSCTRYTLWVNHKKIIHKTLHDALRAFGRVWNQQSEPCQVDCARDRGARGWSRGAILGSENGVWFRFRRSDPMLKTRHLRIAGLL